MRASAKWETNPLSYELEVLTLVNNEGVAYDIRELMLECNIYESITNNFLVGELAIADAVGLLENVKIFGQESLRVKFKQPGAKGRQLIDQIFRIYKVGGVHRIGQNTTVYKLSFGAPELIQAKRIRISQAFVGSMTDIAARLVRDKLGILWPTPQQVEAQEIPKLEPYLVNKSNSTPANFRVVIPNWTVNYTINWLLQQAQGVGLNSGLQDSFFFFQTANGSFRIQSIPDMMTRNYLQKEGQPSTFYYAPAAASNTGDEGWNEVKTGVGAGRRILDYTIGSSARVLDGIIEGLFAQKQITIDNTYGYQTITNYSYLDKFYRGKEKTENGGYDGYPLIRQGAEQIWVGEAAPNEETTTISASPYVNDKIQGKPITSYPDAHTTLLSDSSWVYDDQDKYHQPTRNTHLGSVQLRTAARQLLKYCTTNILISSRTDISVGQMIDLNIPPTSGQTKQEDDSKFIGGKHLITEVKWGITAKECRTNIKVVKASYLNHIETAAGDYAPQIKEG